MKDNKFDYLKRIVFSGLSRVKWLQPNRSDFESRFNFVFKDATEITVGNDAAVLDLGLRIVATLEIYFTKTVRRTVKVAEGQLSYLEKIAVPLAKLASRPEVLWLRISTELIKLDLSIQSVIEDLTRDLNSNLSPDRIRVPTHSKASGILYGLHTFDSVLQSIANHRLPLPVLNQHPNNSIFIKYGDVEAAPMTSPRAVAALIWCFDGKTNEEAIQHIIRSHRVPGPKRRAIQRLKSKRSFNESTSKFSISSKNSKSS